MKKQMDDLKSIPIIEYDDFLKSKLITWKDVGGRVESSEYDFGDCFISHSKTDIEIRLIFSIRFFDNKTFLVLKFTPKEYKLKINESVSFLFENNVLLNFVVTNEPFKSGIYMRINRSANPSRELTFPHFYEVLIPISMKNIEIFAAHKFINWSINFKSNRIIGGDTWMYKAKHKENWCRDKTSFQIALNMFASQFLELVHSEVPDYVEIQENISDEVCNLYLMHDSTNNYYKIGISNSPEYREKTLQSEKPTIVLLCSKSFPKRKIAEILEKTLHDAYSNKRIRGEWFNLNEEDVKDIFYILK